MGGTCHSSARIGITRMKYAASILFIVASLVTPAPALAWDHCGTPQAESDCPTPAPTPSTPVATPTQTQVATPVVAATPPVLVQPVTVTATASAQPVAAAAVSAVQNASPSSPSGTTHMTNVCVYTNESGLIRVDQKSIRDADQWVRTHVGRTDLPNDYQPANGQACGTTLSQPAPTKTPVPQVVAVTSTPLPVVVETSVPTPLPTVNVETTPTPVEVRATPTVETLPTIVVPTMLPATGDGSTYTDDDD